MSKYRIFEAVPSLDKIKIGDLLTVTMPNGNTARGFVTAVFGIDLDNTLTTVFFEDGRAYPVASDANWTACCQFNSAWRPTDPNEEEQQ